VVAVADSSEAPWARALGMHPRSRRQRSTSELRMAASWVNGLILTGSCSCSRAGRGCCCCSQGAGASELCWVASWMTFVEGTEGGATVVRAGEKDMGVVRVMLQSCACGRQDAREPRR